jgi:hypothetical protein
MTARSSKYDFTIVWQVFDAIAETFGVDGDLLRQAAEDVGGWKADLDAMEHTSSRLARSTVRV